MLDVKRIRQDFPILNSGVVYLDNAAASLTSEPVLQEIWEYYHREEIGTFVSTVAEIAGSLA